MEYIQAGQMIRELRKRKGLSQEQLCEGLCEPPTMSKIEKGRQYPSKKLLDALLVRLQEHIELQVPLSSSDFERAQIEREIISRVSCHDDNILELLEQYKTCSATMNNHEQQFYLFALAMYHTGIEEKWELAKEELEKAIHLTIPKYEEGQDISTIMLTSIEFAMLNNIAICNWFLNHKDKAVNLMKQLYDVLEECDSDSEEYAKRLPMICYNLSMWLGIRKDYGKSLSVAEKGIECCLKYGKYGSLTDLLYNKGFTLLCLGRNEEGKLALKKTFMLIYACNNQSAYTAFKEDLLKSFGENVWTAVQVI